MPQLGTTCILYSKTHGEEQAWKPNKETVWITINYAISMGCLDNRQDRAKEEETEWSDKSGRRAESDANKKT